MTDTRTLRADAQQNHDRILEAAAAAFAREGADTSLKAIAQEAGVGIGTLYRRFPTREDLIEATYRDQTARLCRQADALLEKTAASHALRQWMDGFVDYMTTKHGMVEALPRILAAREGLRGSSRDLLRTAIATLLGAGIADGALRDDVAADDVMMALGGITLITENERDLELAARLLDLLMAGLRAESAG
ncbi:MULTISPECIES: TetR/AcrR family transcriptional regulator [unclassified Rathayibacter]|uniref:TetR/AcrR family transcriptional regulator n=1 Tax=unclassified Rathayibacter TaxID=2609250 RepID=UPI00188DA0F7|nr:MULTISPECIES: TetR/AcrR family transcriptional regulator [unclassified Rathayibacter]MBF4461284.1 TetR/AcrR family transcriptional regulator [Rathayibacter sp. VKM Ac-2879]MBF4502695.1 TetR/AcrR family transcriptional regulator [Rathayibacter sp. VKM Ac-2878]